MIVEVNGTKIRDLDHEDLADLVREQSIEEAGTINFTVVSKSDDNDTIKEE